MKNLVNTLKNNDSTTNTGLVIVSLIILPMLVTIVSNIDVNNLFQNETNYYNIVINYKYCNNSKPKDISEEQKTNK